MELLTNINFDHTKVVVDISEVLMWLLQASTETRNKEG